MDHGHGSWIMDHGWMRCRMAQTRIPCFPSSDWLYHLPMFQAPGRPVAFAFECVKVSSYLMGGCTGTCTSDQTVNITDTLNYFLLLRVCHCQCIRRQLAFHGTSFATPASPTKHHTAHYFVDEKRREKKQGQSMAKTRQIAHQAGDACKTVVYFPC